MALQRYLIINCDDFGWDEDATVAILHLAEKRLITSTTIMANLVRSQDLKQLLPLKKISVGCHLNLIDGEPVCKASSVPTLVDNDGRFYSAFRLFQRFLTGRVNLQEVEMEIADQLKKLVKSGIKLSHVDSHQHLHQFPLIGPAILKIIRRKGIRRVRRCRIQEGADLRRLVLKSFYQLTKSSLQGFQTPELLLTTFSLVEPSLEAFQEATLKGFANYQRIEFMSHPGLENRPDSYLHRKEEYNFWLSDAWKDVLLTQQVKLISFNEL